MPNQDFSSLSPLFKNEKLKAVFVGGKGGVGKTTCSSSIAIQFSLHRPKSNTLLISTDPAHNISDAFATQLDGTPKLISNNLYACEVDPSNALEETLNEFDSNSSSDADKFLNDLKSFVQNMPGIDEAMALSSVLHHLKSDTESHELEFDTIVFDTAPTGHTLRLLQLPSLLKAGLNKLQSWQTKIGGFVSSVGSYFSNGEDSTNQKIKLLEQKMTIWLKDMEFLSDLFCEQEKTQFICVCNASFLSISETQRLIAELHEAGIKSEYILVNMLFPAKFSCFETSSEIFTLLTKSGLEKDVAQSVQDAVTLSGGMSRMQQHYLLKLRSDLDASYKIVLLPMLKSEIRSFENLKSFGNNLLQTDNKLIKSDDKPINFDVSGNYVPDLSSKVFKQDMSANSSEEVMVLDLAVNDTVELTGLSSRPELNGHKGVIKKDLKDHRYAVLLDGWKEVLSLKGVNLIKIEKEENDASQMNMENVTPEMISLVQSVLMKPGGIQELLGHPLVTEMKNGNDAEMKTFFADIEDNGLFAGLKYMSNKYVMGNLAKVAKQLN